MMRHLKWLLLGFTVASFFASFAYRASLKYVERDAPPPNFASAVWASGALVVLAAAVTTSRVHVWGWLVCSFAISAWIFAQIYVPMILRTAFAISLFLITWATCIFLLRLICLPVHFRSEAKLNLISWVFVAPFVWAPVLKLLKRHAMRCVLACAIAFYMIGYVRVDQFLPADYDCYARAYTPPNTWPRPGWLPWPSSPDEGAQVDSNGDEQEE
jgi:hypothetical protein